MEPTLPPVPPPPSASAPFGSAGAPPPHSPGPVVPAVPGGYGQPQPGYFAPQPRKSGMGIASLVLGIVGVPLFMLFIPAVLAVVFGAVSMRQIKAAAGRVTGRGMAIAGLVLGVVSIAGGAVFWWAAATDRIKDEDGNSIFEDTSEVVVGGCYDLPDAGEVGDASKVSCSEPHDGQFFHKENLRDGNEAFPGEEEVVRRSETACAGEEFADFVGVPISESKYTVFYLSPQELSWSLRDGEVQCFVANVEDTPLVGSVEGSGE